MIVALFTMYTHDAYCEIVVDDLVGVECRALEVFDTYGRGYGLSVFPEVCQHR